MLTTLSGVFANRVQLSGSSAKYGIPSKCLNTRIVHNLSHALRGLKDKGGDCTFHKHTTTDFN